MRKALQIGAKRSQFTCFLDEAQDEFDVSELVCVSKELDLNAYFRGDVEQMSEVKWILDWTK